MDVSIFMIAFAKAGKCLKTQTIFVRRQADYKKLKKSADDRGEYV